MSLPEAVNRINGQMVALPHAQTIKEAPIEPKHLLLPERNSSNDHVIAYLAGRGISKDIIEFCIRTGRLYESRDYYNAVFVGFDQDGVPRYGALRSTSGSRFMGDVSGSDKRYSFSILAKGKSAKLHLFESAIDLLSFGTLELLEGRDWRQDHCLSLAGVYKPKQSIWESAIPVPLGQYLKDHPLVSAVSLHLDNDSAGRVAAESISVNLKSHIIENCPLREGKDYNEMLQMSLMIKEHSWQRKAPER